MNGLLQGQGEETAGKSIFERLQRIKQDSGNQVESKVYVINGSNPSTNGDFDDKNKIEQETGEWSQMRRSVPATFDAA